MLSDQFVFRLFSFKLCSSWSYHLENDILRCPKTYYRTMVLSIRHGFPLYINVSILYFFKIALTGGGGDRTAGLALPF